MSWYIKDAEMWVLVRLCGSWASRLEVEDVIRAGTWRRGKIYMNYLTSIQLFITGTVGGCSFMELKNKVFINQRLQSGSLQQRLACRCFLTLLWSLNTQKKSGWYNESPCTHYPALIPISWWPFRPHLLSLLNILKQQPDIITFHLQIFQCVSLKDKLFFVNKHNIPLKHERFLLVVDVHISLYLTNVIIVKS